MHRTLITLAAIAAIASPLIAGPADLTKDEAQTLAQTIQENVIVLVDAGKGDMRTLRYTPEVGAETTSTITQNMTISQSMGGMPMPSPAIPGTFYTMNTRVKEITDTGFISETTVTDAGVVDGAEGPLAAAMQRSVPTVKGTLTTTTITSRGFIEDTDTALGPNTTDEAADQVKQMQNMIASVGLPEEQVGVGAVWRQRMIIKSSGLKIIAINTYTLEEMKDDALVLSLQSIQIINEQDLPADTLPPGATAKVKNADSSASSTFELDLTTGAMHSVDLEMEMKMDVGISMQGQQMELQQNVTSKMESELAEEG